MKSAAVSQPETQISTYLKRKHRQTVSSPVTVSLTAAWCMCTARMHPYLGGAMGEMHAKKIANIYDMAMKMGAPVIGLVDCAGFRLQEATDALEAFGSLSEADYGFRRDSADYSDFWQLRRTVSVVPALSDFTFMEKGGKAICEFAQCDSRQYGC